MNTAPQLWAEPIAARFRDVVYAYAACSYAIQSELIAWREKGGDSVVKSLKQIVKQEVDLGNFVAYLPLAQCFSKTEHIDTVDLDRLHPRRMLNEVVINYFSRKWGQTFEESLVLPTHYMASHLTKTSEGRDLKYMGLQDAVTGRNIPWKNIIIPIHLRNDFHWITGVIDFTESSIRIFDSLASTRARASKGSQHLPLVERLQKLVTLLKEASGSSVNWDDWVLEPRAECPKQSNQYDCGVFTLLFILHSLHGGLHSPTVPAEYSFNTFTAEPRSLEGVHLRLIEELRQDRVHGNSIQTLPESGEINLQEGSDSDVE
ncbi:hypothetical protein EVG20_g2319, partial [Dentipellis fragilis]